jgi:predicted porin
MKLAPIMAASALALTLASSAQIALAQSANPVTLYGRAYVMFENSRAGGGAANAAPVAARNKVTDYSSHFGIRGTESLGGGLNAFFQFETGVRLDSNNATFSARNSAVGLQGDFGTLLMGRWDSPYKRAAVTVDPFSNLTAGDLTAVISDRGNFNRRDQNTIQWWSPEWSNVSVKVAHVVNEARTATVKPTALSMSVLYNTKNVYFGYAWEQHKDQFRTYTAGGTAGAVAGGKETGHALVGKFGLGAWELAGQVQRFKKATGTAASVTDIKAFQGVVTYTVGKNEFVYTYLTAKDGLAPTAALQPKSVMNVVGHYYRFSRRTALVTQYLRLNNNAAGLSDAGQAITAGQDPRVISIGMRHTF